MGQFMAANGAKGAVTEILGDGRVVEDGSLHYTCRKDYFVPGWIVVCLNYI